MRGRPRRQLLQHLDRIERRLVSCALATDSVGSRRAIAGPSARRGVRGRYRSSCPAMAPLLAHCGASVYRGVLPWSEHVGDEEDGDDEDESDEDDDGGFPQGGSSAPAVEEEGEGEDI